MRLAVSALLLAKTGWPDRGSAFYGSVPSYENAVKYFINAYKWAEEEGIEIFYFSSFDEGLGKLPRKVTSVLTGDFWDKGWKPKICLEMCMSDL